MNGNQNDRFWDFNVPDGKQDEALGTQIMEEVRRYNDGYGCTRRQLVDNILIAISQSPSASTAVVGKEEATDEEYEKLRAALRPRFFPDDHSG